MKPPENSKQKTALKKGGLWFLQESNQGHMDFQSIALPTELRNHYIFVVITSLLKVGAKIYFFLM